jgi:hypothetical protein
MSRASLFAAAIVAAATTAAWEVNDRVWAATAARNTDKTRPEKRSRTSSHKQNARKAKKKGGAA